MTLGFILGPWFLNIPTGQSTIPGVYFWRVPFAHPIGSQWSLDGANMTTGAKTSKTWQELQWEGCKQTVINGQCMQVGIFWRFISFHIKLEIGRGAARSSSRNLSLAGLVWSLLRLQFLSRVFRLLNTAWSFQAFLRAFPPAIFLPARTARIGIPRIDMTWQSGLWNWGVCHQTSKEWI